MKNFVAVGTLFIAVLLVLAACGNPAGGGENGGSSPPVPVSGTIAGIDTFLSDLGGDEAVLRVRDSGGTMIAEAVAGANGSWSASIPAQYKGASFTLEIVIKEEGEDDRVFDGGTLTINPDGSVGLTPKALPPTTSYTVTKAGETNGSFTVSPASAIAGEVVTVTAVPDGGYRAVGISVSGGVSPTAAGLNTWRFTMLAVNVTVTVTFELIPVTVSAFDLSGLVMAPVKGATPNTTGIDQTQYTGTIVWQTADGSPHTGAFAASTVYKAVVTMTAKTGYTFTGVAANSFSYAGATSVTNAAGSGVVTISFPATLEHDPNTGIPIGNPSVKLYLDGSGTPLTNNGTTFLSVDPGAAAIRIDDGTYTEIIWYVNGNKAAEGSSVTSINLPRQTAGTFTITVEATPQGGVKNSGAHTFVIE
jgi:hypothetical protein